MYGECCVLLVFGVVLVVLLLFGMLFVKFDLMLFVEVMLDGIFDVVFIYVFDLFDVDVIVWLVVCFVMLLIDVFVCFDLLIGDFDWLLVDECV